MKWASRDPDFTTITCLGWRPLLEENCYKDIVIESLRFLSQHGRVIIYAFVIMETHLHLVWQMRGMELNRVQADFLKYTSQTMLRLMLMNGSELHSELEVNKKDRKYQVWMRKSLSVPLWTPKVLRQKVNYMHNNPVKAGLCRNPEEYAYSSARFYNRNEKNWDFLVHYDG